MPPPAARFSIAFDDAANMVLPEWYALDELYPSLVTEYTIDRGRSFELDRCDTGRATVTLMDQDGVLDPTNPSSPYVDKIQPLKQAAIARWNPVEEEWQTRFRGFIDSYEYEFHPSQLVNRVTIELVDIFEVVSAVEMMPGYFGLPQVDTPAESKGQVYFAATPDDDLHGMQIRVNQILDNAAIPDEFKVVFTGNVSLRKAVYSPGESAMAAIQEAVDAEFPAVANVYADRLGRLCVHGRFARFDPDGTAASYGNWDFQDWKAGDGAAVAASPTDTAHIRGFSMSRDASKVINRAMATPIDVADVNVPGQIVQNVPSQDEHGLRPWSAQNLLTKQGLVPGQHRDHLEETKTFADYYVRNYVQPQNRVSSITFRSIDPNSCRRCRELEAALRVRHQRPDHAHDRLTRRRRPRGQTVLHRRHPRTSEPTEPRLRRRHPDPGLVAGRVLRGQPVHMKIQQKPIIHGRDHAPGGADPVPGLGGIAFEVDPQTGGWLMIETTGSNVTEDSEGEFFGISLVAGADTEGGGIYLKTLPTSEDVQSMGITLENNDSSGIDIVDDGPTAGIRINSETAIRMTAPDTRDVWVANH